MRLHDIVWQASASLTDVWPNGPPKLWASNQAVDALRDRGEVKVSDQGGITFERGAQGQQRAVANWIFVPSYRRYSISDQQQMLVDWTNAMKDMSYTRVVIVRPGEEQQASVYHVWAAGRPLALFLLQ